LELGAIFGWDGVIVDSSASHERARERLERELRDGGRERVVTPPVAREIGSRLSPAPGRATRRAARDGG